MESADLAGLETAKKDSFDQITTAANRRGMFYSGIPIEEQASYVGQNYLPGIANLKGRYAGLRGNLYNTLAQSLANYDLQQNKDAREIYNTEVAQDLERERLAQEAAARASSGSGSGGAGISFNTGGDQTTPTAQPPTLRQQWQQEANAGDWNAQVALNYAGDDGRYDGVVNSKAEYDILKAMGITGNYTYRGQPITVMPKNAKTPSGTTSLSGGSGGLQVLGGGGTTGGW
jgi:hypothetical protein